MNCSLIVCELLDWIVTDIVAEAGVVVFDAVSGQLPRKARLEIMLDDGYWPAFGTTKALSTTARWEQVGEGFIKELDFGKIWVRLNGNEEGEREDIIAQYTFDAKPFLERCLVSLLTVLLAQLTPLQSGPVDFTLKDAEARDCSTVKIAAKYIPTDFKLEPRESVMSERSAYFQRFRCL